MAYPCRRHHDECDVVRVIPQPKPTQKILINKNGFLSLGYPLPLPPIPRFPPRSLRRSPLPKSVRNIANTPIFKNTDRSLTSFNRFPPEIRLNIYGYLLISEFPVRYGICPSKMILVHREEDDYEWRDDHEGTCRYWIRHGLFPAILECSRLINMEGSQVLYGKNLFHVENLLAGETIEFWALARGNINAITRLSLLYKRSSWCSQDKKTLELMDLFPFLREVEIWSSYFDIHEWKAFLAEASERLNRMKTFKIGVLMWEKTNEDMLRRHLSMEVSLWGPTRQSPWPLEPLLKAYTWEFKACFQSLFPGRNIRWEGEKHMGAEGDEWGDVYYMQQLKFKALVT